MSHASKKSRSDMTVDKTRRRLLGSVAAIGGLALASGLVGWTDAASAQTADLSSEEWTMPPERPFQVVEHEWIPMGDGVRLSARLWLPDDSATQTVPVVFEYIPYRKRDMYRDHDDAWGSTLASRGIAYARVDVRGSGESEGVLTDEYSTHEHDDAMAIIDWLSRQPWSSGAVGMRGLSWGAINTLQVAARQPAALKAIMVLSGVDNRFTSDAHYIGGTLGRTNFEWGVYFKQVMATPPDPEVVGPQWEAMWRERLEASPPILAIWTEHQHLDAYWKRGSVAFDYGDVRVPTYVVGGLHEPYSDQVGRLLERLEVPRKGLLGPWKHGYPESSAPNGLDWGYEEVRWWSHWLNGDETTGIMDEPMLRAFMQYASRRESLPNPVPGRWIAEQQWPPARLGRRWFLNASGLADEPLSGPPLPVRPGVVVGQAIQQWYGEPGDEQSHDDALSLTFDSPLLEEDVEVLGYPTVRIRVTADKPVAQLAVRVTEVTPEGKSWLVNYGIRNLTHRDSHETPTPLEPGQAYDVEFPLYLMSHRFRQGSRIRVGLSEGLWPLSWPSPEPVQLTIAPGVSSISLPVRPVESEPAPMPIQDVLGTSEGAAAFIPVEPDATGRIVIVSDTPTYTYQAASLSTELSGSASVRSEIVAGDSTSGVWEDSGSMGWKRGDWNCEVRSSYRLTADTDMFHLTESVEALKYGERIFERTESHDIPRRLV